MPQVVKTKARLQRSGTPTGVPRRARDVRPSKDRGGVDGYEWGVDVAGEITLGGLKLVLANRAGLRIRSPLRLT